MSASSIDRAVHQQAVFPRQALQFPVASVGINQAAVTYAAFVPGAGWPAAQPPYAFFGFLVEAVSAGCTAIVATAQVDVKNLTSGVSVLSALLTPSLVSAAGPTHGTLAALANRRFKMTDQLGVVITTNGTGTLTNLVVQVVIRPYPVDGEAA